jgi:hypothetical protein
MINPLDVVARAAAIPSIVLSATNALLAVRRRDSTNEDDPYGSRFAARFTNGFFERIEEQCRTRWADLFASDEPDEPGRSVAA